MGHDDPILPYGHMSFDAWACAICVLFFKVEHVLLMPNCVKWLLSFKVPLLIHAVVVIFGLILSLPTDVMYISVFPGFAGHDSYKVLWAVCLALPSHL